MSTTYPEQIMLPGQTAAPEGPVDMTVMYLMHHGFRRDLRRFAAAVPVTPVGDHQTWVALADRWRRFSEILHHHHTGEDAGIWPFLMERADASEQQTLVDMEAEHERIDPILEGCRDGLAALASPATATTAEPEMLRAALAVRLAEAKELLAHHLRHEETGAIPLIQRYSTQEDWERIDDEHFGDARKDVKFLLFVVPWIGEELPRDVLDKVLADAGLPMRLIWMLGRRRFRRLERTAFRHLPGCAG
jgi:hemerythrin-like domain-containing protein